MNAGELPSDVHAARFPVSVKGVLEIGGRVVLLRNEREEWELPGGKLEPGEDPARCVEREILEELGLHAKARSLIDVWLYDVLGKVEVLVVTFAMFPLDAGAQPRLSHEHKALALFAHDEVPALRMPDGYKRAIAAFRSATAVSRGEGSA